MNKRLHLSKNEFIILEDIVGDELRMLINGYDDDTGRQPGKRRESTLPILTDWHKRLTEIQDKAGAVIHVREKKIGVLLTPEKFRACEMDMTDKEIAIIMRLLEKRLKDYQNFLKTYKNEQMSKDYHTACSLLTRLRNT